MDNIEKYKELFKLIKNHKWDEFLNELEKQDPGFDINIRDDQNNYFLTYSILYNKIDVAKKLIEREARIDITDHEDRSILFIPIKYGYDEMLETLLIANNSNIGVSIIDIKDKNMKIPIHYALTLKNLNAVELLLKFGSSPNIVDRNGYNSLHMAVYSRSPEICSLILKYISNINSRCSTGESALHLSCNLQLVEITKMLLANNINVNLQDYEHEFSALHYCIVLSNRELTSLLLKYKPEINIQDVFGNTPLHYAIINNNFDIFLMLTKSVSTKNILNYNLWNGYGEIPLHIVLKNNEDNVNEYIDIIIEGSNLSIQDNEGNSCLHYIVKLDLWKEYRSILIKKKLNIFSKNYKQQMVIDLIKDADYDKFLDLVSDSYYIRLKNANELWRDEWENLCSREFENVTEDELSKLDSKIQITSSTFQKHCKDTIKEKLINLITQIRNGKELNCYQQSYPVRRSRMCIDLYEGETVKYCTFTGSTLDILIGLVHLLRKHKESCSTLSHNFVENKDLCKFYKSIGIIMNSKCEFLNFEIVWVRQKLYLAEGFYENFKKCLDNKKKRFIIIPLGIEMQEGNHAGYMIYDSMINEVERFEPHGSSIPPGLNYNPSLLDEILESRFRTVNESIKYIRPKDYLPKVGFQFMDAYEDKRKKLGDPKGFCALWAMWYVDMRLTYRDIDRNSLVKMLLKTIRNKNVSYKNMIRNYSKEIIKIRDKVLQASKMDINDWLNDQYTDEQINSFMGLLLNEIQNVIN